MGNRRRLTGAPNPAVWLQQTSVGKMRDQRWSGAYRSGKNLGKKGNLIPLFLAEFTKKFSKGKWNSFVMEA